MTALVDDSDFDRVSRLKWSRHSQGYATAYDPESGGLVLMHRYVAGLEPGDRRKVDHRSHDRLDNRRANLRVGSQSMNMLNRKQTIREGFTSRYRGVAHRGGRSKAACGAAARKPWAAYYGTRYVGVFATEQEAAYCRDLAALRAEGPAAQLNFPIAGLEAVNE
jgi:hypothetical protein